ncbi:hypothetical protein WDU94_014419 [Cyamophila willieti]
MVFDAQDDSLKSDMIHLGTLILVFAFISLINLFKYTLSSVLFPHIEDDHEGREVRRSLFITSVVLMSLRLSRVQLKDIRNLFIYVLYTYACGSLIWFFLTQTLFRLENKCIYGKHPFYSQYSNTKTIDKEKLFVVLVATSTLLLWLVGETWSIFTKPNQVHKVRRVETQSMKNQVNLTKKNEVKGMSDNILTAEYWNQEDFRKIKRVAFDQWRTGKTFTTTGTSVETSETYHRPHQVVRIMQRQIYQ